MCFYFIKVENYLFGFVITRETIAMYKDRPRKGNIYHQYPGRRRQFYDMNKLRLDLVYGFAIINCFYTTLRINCYNHKFIKDIINGT